MDARQKLFADVERLVGDETGTVRKEAPFRVALCYPSPYHVGMSSLGFQTIYRELNGRPGTAAERAFLPDDVEAYRRARCPLFTYETRTPVSSFGLVAFSVSYELEVAGLLDVLDLAGLPVLAEERRRGEWPLIVAGGPLTFSNPAPLEPFVDVLVQGEGDDLVHQLMDLWESLPREALLDRLAKTPGFFVPGRGGARGHVHKASQERLPARSRILTPHTELRSMFLVEPERGCSRGCHYCVMRRTTNGGMRVNDVEQVLSLIPDQAKRVGLVGAAVTDHPKVVPLLRAIVDSGRQVGVSSLRADRLTKELVEALRDGGAQHLTVASDGPSQRLRDMVDRKHTEEQILRAARLAKAAGLRQLKVYSIVGLPTETEADIDELVAFTLELSKILPTALGVAPFVAKRNTPMDGAPFFGIKEVEERLQRLRKGLRGRAEVRPTSARWAWVEHMLAQAGPEAGLAVMDAWRDGGTFAAYKRAFEARGVTPYLERRVPDGRRNPTVWPTVPDVRGPVPDAAVRG